MDQQRWRELVTPLSAALDLDLVAEDLRDHLKKIVGITE